MIENSFFSFCIFSFQVNLKYLLQPSHYVGILEKKLILKAQAFDSYEIRQIQ